MFTMWTSRPPPTHNFGCQHDFHFENLHLYQCWERGGGDYKTLGYFWGVHNTATCMPNTITSWCKVLLPYTSGGFDLLASLWKYNYFFFPRWNHETTCTSHHFFYSIPKKEGTTLKPLSTWIKLFSVFSVFLPYSPFKSEKWRMMTTTTAMCTSFVANRFMCI